MPWWWPVITLLFGSGGAFTVIWFLFTRQINKADQKYKDEKEALQKAVAEEERKQAEAEEERAEANRREWLIVKERRQRLERLLFWMIAELMAIIEKTNHHPMDGHLQKAWDDFSTAETNLKNFEDEQASSLHKD